MPPLIQPPSSTAGAPTAKPEAEATKATARVIAPEDRQLAVSDELTAAETGGWFSRYAGHGLTDVTHVEHVTRLVELHAATKPVLRALSVVAKSISDAKFLRVMEGFRYGFGALASVATGYEQYKASPMKTVLFRDVDAGLAGAVDFAFGVAMPIVALVDGILNFALPKIAPGIKVASGGFISGNLASAVRGLVALAEGYATGDFSAASAFAKKAQSGDFGAIFEGGAALCGQVAAGIRATPIKARFPA